jgi:hypothetical protein
MSNTAAACATWAAPKADGTASRPPTALASVGRPSGIPRPGPRSSTPSWMTTPASPTPRSAPTRPGKPRYRAPQRRRLVRRPRGPRRARAIGQRILLPLEALGTCLRRARHYPQAHAPSGPRPAARSNAAQLCGRPGTLLGQTRTPVHLPWRALEQIPDLLRGRGWMLIGGTYSTSGTPTQPGQAPQILRPYLDRRMGRRRAGKSRHPHHRSPAPGPRPAELEPTGRPK